MISFSLPSASPWLWVIKTISFSYQDLSISWSRGVASIVYRGSKFRNPCSTQAPIHQLRQQLATIYNMCYPVYDYSHYIVKIKSLTHVHCDLLNARCINRAGCCSCSFNSWNWAIMLKLYACAWLANYLNPVAKYCICYSISNL